MESRLGETLLLGESQQTGQNGRPSQGTRVPVIQNIYDNPIFFEKYLEYRKNPCCYNNAFEQPVIKSCLPSLRGKSVLDIGFGFGDFCRYARDQGAARVMGIDVSENMFRVARETTSDSSISFVNVAIEDFEYAGALFDLVVSSLTLHYVENLSSIFRKISDWLVPHGLYVFSVNHPIYTASLEGLHADEAGNKYWPVNRYRSEGIRKHHWLVDGVVKYHRTMETYFRLLQEYGFILKRLLEPEALPEFMEQCPELEETHHRPIFVVMSAEKNSVNRIYPRGGALGSMK